MLTSPVPSALGSILSELDAAGYAQTSSWPLFAARCWSFDQERTAWRRFKDGLCNTQEVAVPRWYWPRKANRSLELFRTLTLGQPLDGWTAPQALREMFDATGKPQWRIIPRFGRYILASPHHESGDDYVYFGDDTLYLMARGRELLGRLSRTESLSVLDLCCGGGGVGLALPEFEGDLLGVDINPQAISLAQAAAQAQSLTNYRYHLGSVDDVLNRQYDLVIGNPPSLPPELGGLPTVYATGGSAQWIGWLEKLVNDLSPTGRALLTVFSVADGPREDSIDPLRASLSTVLKRGYSYTVRRQFPMPERRWLRHVALEIKPATDNRVEQFEIATGTLQLPGLAWRRSIGR